MAFMPQPDGIRTRLYSVAIASGVIRCLYQHTMGEREDNRSAGRKAPVRSKSAIATLTAFCLGLAITHTTLQAQEAAPPPTFTTSFAPFLTQTTPDLRIPADAVDMASFKPKLDPRKPKPQLGGKVVRSLGTGVASYYGKRFHGRLTANGERFNMRAMTAAHKTLPFGTKVRVTNPRNGRAVVVRINDRGPFIRGRTIDLSRGAAERIGMIASGHARVKLEIVR